MVTPEAHDRITGWFTGRLPQDWQQVRPAEVTVDREEVTVVVALPDVEIADTSTAQVDEARAGRARAFREDTRERRIMIAKEAEHRFQRKVSWGVVVGEGDAARRELFTHLAVPVMSRLRQPERLVLETLVEAGVARSRADALGWCVRLVAEHEGDWLAELREAMTEVAEVRRRGPAA